MSLTAVAARAVERAPVPDALTRLGVGYLVARARRQLDAGPGADDVGFALDMGKRPIAVGAEAANRQHYEVPAEFFAQILGPRRKYSSCLYGAGATTLAEAEERALVETMAHADLA